MNKSINTFINYAQIIVSNFLLSNGALSNGYSVSMKGYINDKSYSLDWHTTEKMFWESSKKELKERSSEFISKIRSLMKKHDIPKIVFETQHVEYGCNKIYISVVIEKELKLL